MAQLNIFTEPKTLLAQERQAADFNVRQVTHFLDGGSDKTALLETIMAGIERNPNLRNDNCYDLTPAEQREKSAKCLAVVADLLGATESEEERFLTSSMLRLADPVHSTRLGLHTGLFLNALKTNGTAKQVAYWHKRGALTNRKFFGCFAMTEMGHGSNVAGLETTATFDEKTDEFIVNTPNEAAMKWWIGAAAHTANHCVCFARLIVKTKDYGIKAFVVPLRSVEDHAPLAGIAIGDIGKKMGRDSIDNGWIKFSNVRIPRQFLLMRYCKVDRSGKVTQPPLQQLTYGPLIIGRASMADDAFQAAKRFITIAVRYASIRRQFSSGPGTQENRLLDYVYHQRRLMPRLAYTYAMKSGSTQVLQKLNTALSNLDKVNANDKHAFNRAVTDIKETFVASAGLKAFSTWGTADIIDECRQACGGHGYSGYNGFGQGYNDWVVNCTWEGDNNVLTLSVGRSLIQTGLAIRQGKQIGGWATGYLNRHKQLKGVSLNGRDVTDPKVIIEAFEAISTQGILAAADKYAALLKKGLFKGQVFEELSQQRFEIARVHIRLFLLMCFFKNIEENADPNVRVVLNEVAVLFGLWSLENEAKLFLKYRVFTSEGMDKATVAVNEYCYKVRQRAVGLTDAFNLSDYFINSPLGSYDGDVYKQYFAKVTSRNSPEHVKPPYYKQLHEFLSRTPDPKDNVAEME